MKTVADESDFPPEELARQLLLYLNGSFSADSSASPPPEQLKSPKLEIEYRYSSPLRTVSPNTQLSDTEFKEKFLKEQKRCKCKKSRCLKLSSLESKKRKTPVNLPSSNRGIPFNCSVQYYKQPQICTPALSFSKFKCRSMIADIDLMDVCFILLGESASVNILSGKGSPINIEVSPGPIALTGDTKEDRDYNTDTYIEKEKLVLVKFRDFLDRIIARGNIKDKWSTSHGSGNMKV